MRKIVYKSTAYKFIVILLAIIAIILVFPGRVFKTTLAKELTHVTSASTDVINYQNTASQVFVSNGTHLDRVKIYVSEGTVTDYFHLILTDAKGKQLADEKVTIDAIPGYIDVLMDVDTVVGDLYTLKATSLQSLYLGQENWILNPDIIAISFYNTTQLDGMNLVMDYYYLEPLSLKQNLFAIGIIVLAALVLIALGTLIFKDKDKLVSVETCVKWILNPIAAALCIFCLVAIALGKVSKHGIDNTVAVVGVLLLGLIMFYGINHKSDGIESVVTREYVLKHIPDFIQSIAIAGAIQACCEYVSGLYDIHHRVAERKEMLWFALIVIAMFELKEIVNIYNLIYIVAAGIGGIIYYKNNVVGLETKEDIFVLRATVAIAVLLGLIIIRTVIGLIKKKMSRPNILFASLLGIYFVGIIVFRNTRWWTVTLAVSFLLLFINYGMLRDDRKKDFIINVLRGAVLQFVLLTIWCWMRRPYCTFRSARYTHFFHTETITATYLTMMLCVALCVLLIKAYKVKEKLELRLIWKELLLFGTVATYLLMTMARTAYAAAIVTVLFGIILVFVRKKNEGCSIKNVLKLVGMMCLSVIICIPVIFEIQRTIPCLVSNPYEYEIDNFQDETKRGRKLNAEEYMRVGELVNVFANKIFGAEENSIDVYGEYSREFNEYHMTIRELYETGAYDWHDVEVTDEQWDMLPNEEQFEAYINRYDYQEAFLEEAKAAGENIVIEAGQEDPAVVEEAKAPNDYTNGRLDIYKSYIEQLNMTGHDGMGAVLKDGEIATHAHDVYLQVAYDHGIPMAFVFVVFGISSFVIAILLYLRNRKSMPYTLLSSLTIIAFAVAGLVEWTFHLGHPMSFVMLLTITPLVFGNLKKEAKENE